LFSGAGKSSAMKTIIAMPITRGQSNGTAKRFQTRNLIALTSKAVHDKSAHPHEARFL
jgi:hypothetical protein